MIIGTIDRRAINRWREELLRAGINVFTTVTSSTSKAQ